jgi:hypothetical protein
MIMSIPNLIPQKCGNSSGPSKLDVQVLSATGNFIRIGSSRDELLTPLPFAGGQGITFDATAGVVELQWLGDVWVCGLSTNAVQPVIDLRMTRY